MNGVPAIAFSARENGNPSAAEAYLPVVLEALLARPAEPGRVWNVNFPDGAAAQCKGVLYGRTPAACSFYDNDYVRTGDALSIRVTNPGPDRCKEGSDIHAVLHGYVSVGAIRSPLFKLTGGGYCQDQRRGDAVPLGLRAGGGRGARAFAGRETRHGHAGAEGLLAEKQAGGILLRLPEGTAD